MSCGFTAITTSFAPATASGFESVVATVSNAEAVAGAALVVIAVKPQDIEALLGEIGPLVLPQQTVLTIAAAIPTARLERRLAAGVPVVRAMPNTPAVVHEGIAGIAPGAHASDGHVALAEEAFDVLRLDGDDDECGVRNRL